MILNPYVFGAASPAGWVLRPTPDSLTHDEQGPVLCGTGNLVVSPGNNFNAGSHPITQVSTDGGLNFTRHDHFGTVGAARLISGAFGDGVFVLGAQGTGINTQGLFTTADGVTLTRCGPSAKYGVFGIDHNGQSGASSRFMAVGGDNTLAHRFIQISADNGSTWAPCSTTGVTRDPVAVAHNRQAGAAGRWAIIDDNVGLWVSADDGATWVAQTIGNAGTLYDIAHNGLASPNGRFIATAETDGAFSGGAPRIVTSTDAAAWSVVVLPFTAGDVVYPSGVGYGGSQWLITSEDIYGGDTGPSFAISTDGLAWTGKNDAAFDTDPIPNTGGQTYRDLAYGLRYGFGKFFMGRNNSANGNGDDMVMSYSP